MMVETFFKKLALAILPELILQKLRTLRERDKVHLVQDDGFNLIKPEWDAVEDESEVWYQPAGWAHKSIAQRQLEKWESFMAAHSDANPFGRSHEADPNAPLDVSAHNTVMTFGYVMGRVVSECDQNPSILDWGGGLGHYAEYMRHLFPSKNWNYVLKDLPELCEVGIELNPNVKFVSDESEVYKRKYDIVFASSSLHYTRDIYGLVDRLCSVSDRYFFVTRTPFVDAVDDFVVVQRPHKYGYLTEYAGWFLNRKKFQEFVEKRGFKLDREFLLAERPYVPNAPEQCVYRGLLFRRVFPINTN